MSVTYTAIGWNRQKKIYDTTLTAGCVLYLAIFIAGGTLAHPNATAETLIIRAFGTLSILLLHVILCIGPLCRLDKRFLPLLYNRRHLGVTMFLTAAVHAIFSLIQFHAFGDVNPLVSLLASNTRFNSLIHFPFQLLGFLAFIILFLMAATSHDFWLHTLTPRIWKRLHMLVYFAYALLLGHIALGALQSERSPVLAATLALGAITVTTLHIAAQLQPVAPNIIKVENEKVAVFQHDGNTYALSNVCRHQRGPLGEGQIVNGCVTCPWHGYQYDPKTGTSPPPYNDQVETFQTKLENGKLLVTRCST